MHIREPFVGESKAEIGRSMQARERQRGKQGIGQAWAVQSSAANGGGSSDGVSAASVRGGQLCV